MPPSYLPERPDLAPYAARSAESRGRVYQEPGGDERGSFERDRDRIVHCAAFRRLEYKTQVFINHEGDYYRTRLTHSLEVAQIGRAVARRLGLNEDLVEALSLAHDLGHTPFGHSGESVLGELMAEHGGFEHNLQSYRIVTELEERYHGFPGLNLSFETREGIVKHSGELTEGVPEELLPGTPPTLEAELIDFVDEIAYNNHDIDDGLKAGLFTVAQLMDVRLWKEAWERMSAAYPGADDRTLRHRTVSSVIDFLVRDLVAATSERLAAARITSLDDVRAHPGLLARYRDDTLAMNLELKRFLMENMYRHHKVEQVKFKTELCMKGLFAAYVSRPILMPRKHLERVERCGLHRTVADYLAGMTDRFACEEYARLYESR